MKSSYNPKFASIILTALGLFHALQTAACPVFDSTGDQIDELNDPLFELLQLSERCPGDVIQLRSLISDEGGKLSTTMVANRGFHNPRQGSFSFFEMVELDTPRRLKKSINKFELFFGHFIAPSDGDTLTLDQNPFSPSLMIELIAWDEKKHIYNFYEVIGSREGAKWFYRGDSKDIWADTTNLHRTRAQGESVFGRNLRCSGCHVAGGPIMKEISEPHDSWWSPERPLPFGGRKPDAIMQAVMKTLQPPETLRNAVLSGLDRLTSGNAFRTKVAESPQIALRPLFCPEEINLETTPWPFDSQINQVLAPLGFFIDTRLGAHAETRAPRDFYVKALEKLNSRFPETTRPDADHAWMTPVKATADKMAVDALIASGTIDQEFMMDVLAIDLTGPVFSPRRCELLKLLPSKWGKDWMNVFIDNLKESSAPQARELLSNLTDPARNSNFHRIRSQRFIENCQLKLQTERGVEDMARYLGQVRAEISASEISENPLGQILEPGFRVIFPKFGLPAIPWRLSLNEACQVE